MSYVISGITGLGELAIKTRVGYVIHPPVSWSVAAYYTLPTENQLLYLCNEFHFGDVGSKFIHISTRLMQDLLVRPAPDLCRPQRSSAETCESWAPSKVSGNKRYSSKFR